MDHNDHPEDLGVMIVLGICFFLLGLSIIVAVVSMIAMIWTGSEVMIKIFLTSAVVGIVSLLVGSFVDEY